MVGAGLGAGSLPIGGVVDVLSPEGAVVTVVSGGGWVVVVVGSVVEVAVVVVVVGSVGPGAGLVGDVVVGAGVVEGGGCVGGGNRSSKVTGGHIWAACAEGLGAPTANIAPTRMSATTRPAPSLPFMVRRLPNGVEVGNRADLRYVCSA